MPESMHIHGYDMLRMIGKGGFATVWEAERLGVKVAMKFVPMKSIRSHVLLQREVNILREVTLKPNPNIIRYSDLFTYSNGFFIVLEWAPLGDLAGALQRCAPNPFHDDEVAFVAHQLVHGLEFMHARRPQQIVHRDLKPSNILIFRSKKLPDGQVLYDVKISDFGLSRELASNDVVSTWTHQYSAPELSTKQYNHKVDLWSLGIVLFVLLVGNFPGWITAAEASRQHPSQALVDESVAKELSLTGSALSFLRVLLQIQPADRLDAASLREMEWLSEVSQVASKHWPAFCKNRQESGDKLVMKRPSASTNKRKFDAPDFTTVARPRLFTQTQANMVAAFQQDIKERGLKMTKKQPALIRKANIREHVVTKFHGRDIPTSDVFVLQAGSVVVKAPTRHQETYVLSHMKFDLFWETRGWAINTDDPRTHIYGTKYGSPSLQEWFALRDQGFQWHKPKRGNARWVYGPLTSEELDRRVPSRCFESSWGAVQVVMPGDFLGMGPVENPTEVYLMPADVVENYVEDEELA